MQDRYQVRLSGEVSRSKDAIQLLQAYHNRSSTHDTDDCRVQQEACNNPQSRLVLQHGMRDRYHVRFGGEVSQSKHALQLLQRYYSLSPAYEAHDR